MKKPGRTRKNEPSTEEDREEDEGKDRQKVAIDGDCSSERSGLRQLVDTVFDGKRNRPRDGNP
jgi:hypothetical protein